MSTDQPPPINITVSPPSVCGRAAHGDASAFAELAALHFGQGQAGDLPHIVAFARASDCSRFAVLARGERGDWLTHISMLEHYGQSLANAGFGGLAIAPLAEAVAAAESMADDGDEEMAKVVATVAETLAPEVLSMARDLRASAIAAISTEEVRH